MNTPGKVHISSYLGFFTTAQKLVIGKVMQEEIMTNNPILKFSESFSRLTLIKWYRGVQGYIISSDGDILFLNK